VTPYGLSATAKLIFHLDGYTEYPQLLQPADDISVKKLQFKPWCKGDDAHIQNSTDHFCEDIYTLQWLLLYKLVLVAGCLRHTVRTTTTAVFTEQNTVSCISDIMRNVVGES